MESQAASLLHSTLVRQPSIFRRRGIKRQQLILWGSAGGITICQTLKFKIFLAGLQMRLFACLGAMLSAYSHIPGQPMHEHWRKEA
jgi:hypothetical protein